MATINSYFKSTSSKQTVAPTERKAATNTTTIPKADEEKTVPWVEKYRPKKVDEVVCQEEVVAVLKKCIEGAALPNLLLYGPPGTGKTSAAVALCRQLFRTPQMYKDRVLEMNASDERGIDIVRNRIKEFSRISVSSTLKNSKDALVPLKIVILDEADAMTGAAQSALRRTMENETQTTRFFLICNYITRIIEPLTSRCAKFRFKPLSAETQKQRLTEIAKLEKVNVDTGSIDELVSISGGDLRKSITLLQSMACSGKAISVEDVRETSGQIPDDEINKLIEVITSMNQLEIMEYVEELTNQGYNAVQLISQLADTILHNDTLVRKHKSKLHEKIAVIEGRLLEGADDYLQLLDLALNFQACLMEVD